MNKVNVNKVVDYANLLKENERLNNIINELEKFLVERIEYNQGSKLQDYLENTYSMIYSELQELKGSDKE